MSSHGRHEVYLKAATDEAESFSVWRTRYFTHLIKWKLIVFIAQQKQIKTKGFFFRDKKCFKLYSLKHILLGCVFFMENEIKKTVTKPQFLCLCSRTQLHFSIYNTIFALLAYKTDALIRKENILMTLCLKDMPTSCSCFYRSAFITDCSSPFHHSACCTVQTILSQSH